MPAIEQKWIFISGCGFLHDLISPGIWETFHFNLSSPAQISLCPQPRHFHDFVPLSLASIKRKWDETSSSESLRGTLHCLHERCHCAVVPLYSCAVALILWSLVYHCKVLRFYHGFQFHGYTGRVYPVLYRVDCIQSYLYLRTVVQLYSCVLFFVSTVGPL